MNELHMKIIKALLEKEMEGANHDVITSILGHEEHDDDEEKNEGDLAEEHGSVDEPTEKVHSSLDSAVSDVDDEDEDEEARRIAKAFGARQK